jgi:hypothetical protein
MLFSFFLSNSNFHYEKSVEKQSIKNQRKGKINVFLIKEKFFKSFSTFSDENFNCRQEKDEDEFLLTFLNVKVLKEK